MYLVVARSAHDDVPVRMYATLKEAKLYAVPNWDKADREACEDLYKDIDVVCKSLGYPSVGVISGIDIVRFKDGKPVSVVWSARQ